MCDRRVFAEADPPSLARLKDYQQGARLEGVAVYVDHAAPPFLLRRCRAGLTSLGVC